jgi:hypothetical protein
MTSASPNYPGNSHKAKESAENPKKAVAKTTSGEEREKKVEQVVTGGTSLRKKSLGKRIAEAFTGDDSKSVGHFILFDVVVPATKQLLSDIATQGVERILFGDNARTIQQRNGGYRSGSSYNRPVQRATSQRQQPSQRARATHDFTEVAITDRAEAQQVLDDLTAALDQFDVITVSDFYDAVGVTGSFQDDKWGWYDLRGARIVRVREGYVIDFPKPEPVE